MKRGRTGAPARGTTLNFASSMAEFRDYSISELVSAVITTRTPPSEVRHGVSYYSLPNLRAALRRVRAGDLDTGSGAGT